MKEYLQKKKKPKSQALVIVNMHALTETKPKTPVTQPAFQETTANKWTDRISEVNGKCMNKSNAWRTEEG